MIHISDSPDKVVPGNVHIEHNILYIKYIKLFDTNREAAMSPDIRSFKLG